MMKAISKDDLIVLLAVSAKYNLFEDDLESILKIYGDDWYIEDGKWVKSVENKQMCTFRKAMEQKAISYVREAIEKRNSAAILG